MINSITIAFRNTLRNKRRTVFSIVAIAIGGTASLLVGAFVASVYYNLQTQIIRQTGHIHIHKKGYFKYGIAKSGQYDIENYQKIIQTIQNSNFADRLNVITPIVTLSGIVSNPVKNSSMTFTGIGLVAENMQKMSVWNGFAIESSSKDIPFESIKQQKGLIGEGLAINLGLCKELHIAGCIREKENKHPKETGEVDEEMMQFALETNSSNASFVDMMVAPAKGAPNITSLQIDQIWKMNQKSLDDRFIAMPLETAQALLYGNNDKKVNAIMLQLKENQYLNSVTDHLKRLFASYKWDLEVITLDQFYPQFTRVLGMFGFIFGFVSIVMMIVILFSISNTMTMSVMERYKEIGTLRSMGVKKWGIRKYFILEGAILGITGATISVVSAFIITTIINHSGITWSPPSSSGEVKLILELTKNPLLIVTVWILLVGVTVISSFFAANKAAKISIVEALRYK